ncbi:Myb DNA-bind 3 domain-containing protein [Citrus sinensis]|uniref:Myb DNA-bind 3 domain-containing protein n=1 Tax=Citrus sinensis TaxID=2711 RepID=A0ACB8JVV0_CITSI|nr:Myb DNA-bind 3 domain-containing protein [Citrus sinensis]
MDRQAPQAPKSRFWSKDEDIILVQSLLDLYHDGRIYSDNNFRSGYLKVLKLLWTQNYLDMLTGPNCSGFGWDPDKKIVTAEKAMWDAYIHTVNFQHNAFPFYEDLCLIYGKDHATGKNAQAPVDAIEKIERTRVCKEAEGENLNFEGVQDNMDDSMFISHAPKKQIIDDLEESRESFKELTYIFVTKMKETSSRLNSRIKLKKIGTLTMVERLRTTTLIARDNVALNVFYSVCDGEREVLSVRKCIFIKEKIIILHFKFY